MYKGSTSFDSFDDADVEQEELLRYYSFEFPIHVTKILLRITILQYHKLLLPNL